MSEPQDISIGSLTSDTTKRLEEEALTMHVRIYSPFKVFYDEAARSISGTNATGPFDILPHHHNFITLLTASELTIVRLNGASERIRISGGIMHVKADRVVVFLDV